MTVGQDARYDVFDRSIRGSLRLEAYRLCGDWHEAEDLAQITLYNVYRRWHQLRAHDQLAGYTRRALVHTFVGEHRRHRWQRESLRADLPDRPDTAGTEVDRLTLLDALEQLGSRQRAAVMLRFWHDLTVDETATVLHCSPGTVASQTHRALRKLRSILTDSEFSGDRAITQIQDRQVAATPRTQPVGHGPTWTCSVGR